MDLRPRPESPAPVIERSRHLPRRTKLAFSAGSLEEAVVDAAGITRFLLFMILIRTTKTFYTVRHAALGAELTEDYHERTSIFGYNAVTGMVGGVGFGVFLLVVVFPSTAEYSNGLLNEGRHALLAAFGAVTIVIRARSQDGRPRGSPLLWKTRQGNEVTAGAASMKGRGGWAGGGATQAARRKRRVPVRSELASEYRTGYGALHPCVRDIDGTADHPALRDTPGHTRCE